MSQNQGNIKRRFHEGAKPRADDPVVCQDCHHRDGIKMTCKGKPCPTRADYEERAHEEN